MDNGPLVYFDREFIKQGSSNTKGKRDSEKRGCVRRKKRVNYYFRI